jgi:putative Mg2+ transporter-C (MgtC) family protein
VVLAGGSPSVLQVQVAFLTPVQAIAAGIGFLGAGTIFVGRHQHQAHGLTTAASIWVTAAIGVVVGCDRFLLAFGAAVLSVIILRVLIRFEPRPEAPSPGLVLPSSETEGSGGST